jgi:hypothetical protein
VQPHNKVAEKYGVDLVTVGDWIGKEAKLESSHLQELYVM